MYIIDNNKLLFLNNESFVKKYSWYVKVLLCMQTDNTDNFYRIKKNNVINNYN